VSGSQATLGSVPGNDVQITGGTGDITDQTSVSIRTLNIAGNDNLFLDNPSSATLTVSGSGILKTGGNASTISGGGGVTAQGAEGDLVIRTALASDALTIATPILASTTGGLTKSGPGSLTLASPNYFTGPTNINGGTLTLGDPGALQNSTLNLSNSGGSLSFGSLTTATLGGLSGNQNLALTNASSGNVTVTVGGNNLNTNFYASISGGGSLTKVGTGTLTLSGVNSYTGPTSVTGGVLDVTGSMTNGITPADSGALGSVAVNNGGVLAGTGILGPVTVNSGGSLQPGNLSGLPASPLNVASLTLSDGSAFALNLGAFTSDSVVAAGAISLSGAVNLTLNLTADPTEGTAFTILSGASVSGDLSWQGAALSEGSLFSVTTGSFSQLFEITYEGAAGTAVDLIAVPEPPSIATLFGSFGVLLGWNRLRRRRHSSRV
jgi:autotransporter-associated beta strand protein